MSDTIFTRMIVAMAVCESTGIYSLVIALIILFAGEGRLAINILNGKI